MIRYRAKRHKIVLFLAHSIGMSLCNREASVVRLSVRL